MKTPSPTIWLEDLDHLVEDITSDRRLEDVKGITNPTGSEPVKSMEKKRKASATDFAPALQDQDQKDDQVCIHERNLCEYIPLILLMF